MSQTIEQLSDEIERIAGNATQLPSVAVAEWVYEKFSTLNALKFACEGELAKARERIQELEAQCAVMREALKLFPAAIAPAGSEDGYVFIKDWEKFAESINETLESTTAGRDLLARLERMEAPAGELTKTFIETGRLRAALRPFARMDIGGMLASARDGYPVYARNATTLTVGDFRNAQKALTPTKD